MRCCLINNLITNDILKEIITGKNEKNTFMRSFVIFRFKFNPWQQLKPLYSKTDTLPKVVYKDLDERPLPKIEMQGRTYLGDAMRSLKPEEVQSIDVDKTRQVMLVELKPGYHPVLMSLSDIKKIYKSEHAIFWIEDHFVQRDPNEVLVDESNIMLISISPIKFFGGLEDLYMVTLVPRTDKNLKKLNEIRIR